MATEEQKKERMRRLFNDIIFGYGKGLWDLFGEASQATAETIGEDILEDMERELGLEIHGENPQALLTEIERLIIDEYGMVKSARLEISDHEVDIFCEGCQLWNVTQQLKEAGVPPYHCVPMMMARAALHKRLGKKARLIGIKHDAEKRSCEIDIELV
ncbi:MAG: hypothetical protein GXP47_13155 [Acidobacteria bacterium]|nr:hypothetical protein [Acidobacteriota bacterium]